MSLQIRDRIKEFRRVPASELRPNPRNWRTHPAAQMDAIRGVLSEIGFAGAELCRELPDGSLMLIDGHARAEIMGDNMVPVLVLDVDEAEANKLLATFDPIGAMAEADKTQLDALLREVDTGSEALQKMLAELATDAGLYLDGAGEIVEDEVPEPPVDPVTKPGDLWVMGEHRLLCGKNEDASNLARLFGNGKADLIVTSPPYNQNISNFSKSGMHKETKWVDQTKAGSYFDDRPESEYQKWQIDSVKAWSAFLTETASIFYNHKNRFRDKQCISPWRWIDQTGAKVRQEIIWMREGSVTQNMRGFMPCDERIFWLYFGKEFLWIESTEHKTWSTVWRINSQKDHGQSVHGCAFPVELPARAIRACSVKGMIVFEPYGGSGTTLIAAEQLERRCYISELDPKFCDVIFQRWEKLTGKKAVLEKPVKPTAEKLPAKTSAAKPKKPAKPKPKRKAASNA